MRPTCALRMRVAGLAAVACSFAVAAIASAAPPTAVDSDTARCAAQRWLERIDTAGTCGLETIRAVGGADDAALYYRVDLAPTGYIIVTGDTRLPPVIAYSMEADAGTMTANENPLADLLEWDLTRRLADRDIAAGAPAAAAQDAWQRLLDGEPRGPVFQQWPPAGSTPTGGWITTNWTQSSPYNNLCPMDLAAGQRSIAGCPAVAMAQIVNYHARLNGVRFTDADDYYHNYGGNQYWIDNAYQQRSFQSWPQLNTHLGTLFGNYFFGTTPTNTSKAALVYACGVAAHQVYTASGSGTFEVAQAFMAFQKFNCTTAELLTVDNDALRARVKQNMIDARPAHLAVVNADWTVGHNLVLDGYNTDDYFHLNFGWGGSYNGWYRLLVGMPYSLTVIEGVIVDIMIDDCAAMDCNCDTHVDATDFTYLNSCVNGPAVACTTPGCHSFDGDGDDDVDLADVAAFQTAFGH